MPRMKKVPSRFESGELEPYHYHEKPEDENKQVYYKAFDRVIACIRERNLLSAVHKQECLEDATNCVHSFYGDDFCKARLKDQLRL